MRILLCLALVAVVLTTAAAAQPVYVPKNTPTSGTANSWPFSAVSSRTQWRYQLITDAKLLGGQPFTVTDIAFAPSSSGTHTSTKFEVRMSHSTVATSTSFAANLPNPVQVLGTFKWSWKAVAKTWCPLGLTKTFNYNGKDRLTIEIRYINGALSGYGGACYYDNGTTGHDRIWKYGTSGIFNTPTGSVGAGSGLKMRLTVTRAQVVPSGTAKPGTTLDFNLLAASEAGKAYQLGSSLGQGPIPIGTWKLELSPDNMLVASTSGLLPTVFQNFAGKFDTAGKAVAKLAIPNIPALKGVRFYTAFVSIDPAKPMGVGVVSPNALVTIQ